MALAVGLKKYTITEVWLGGKNAQKTSFNSACKKVKEMNRAKELYQENWKSDRKRSKSLIFFLHMPVCGNSLGFIRNMY